MTTKTASLSSKATCDPVINQPVTVDDSAGVATGGRGFSGEQAYDGTQETRLLGLWRYRGIILMMLDAAAISCSFMLAYFLRYKWPVIATRSVPAPDIILYLHGSFLLTVFWVFLIWKEKGYESGIMGISTFLHKMRLVTVSGLFAIGLLMAISFLYKPFLISRLVYIMTSVLALGTLALSRLLFKAVDEDLAAHGMVAERVVVAGLNRQSAEFASLLAFTPSLCSVVGFIRLDSDMDVPGSYEGYPVLGDMREIRKIHGNTPFEKLVLPNAVESDETNLIDALNFCESESISMFTVPNRFHIAVDQKEVSTFSGIPVILMRDSANRPVYAVIKRFFDIMGALLILAVGAPAWLGVALAVKLYDRGPVFFTQKRAGLHGKAFRMYKFRSMVVNAEERLKELVNLDELDEPVFKIRKDPRVTPFGRFLRRTGLDEIPQLINVLKGEMSLVGPRPEETSVAGRYTPWQRRRLKAVPGITGHQQVHNRGEASLSRRIEFDLVYIKHQGLLLDVYILLKTVKVVLSGSGVTH